VRFCSTPEHTNAQSTLVANRCSLFMDLASALSAMRVAPGGIIAQGELLRGFERELQRK
jgi:hypothetical protein